MTSAPPTERDLERVRGHLVELGAGALTMYKGPCFDRRLASRLRIRGVASVGAYADLLDRDPEERRKLLSAIAIGVTSFFRNPPAWRRLAQLLADNPYPGRLTAWSAGCATGEETFSIAMVLAGLASRGSIGDWSVLGTDVDERSLAVARAGDYPARVAAEIEAAGAPPMGEVVAGRFRVDGGLRARVSFRRDDLLAPAARLHCELVVCRNVLIYFGPEGQVRAIRSLVDAARLGGLVMLGKAELAAADVPLELVDRRERIYRRVE